VSSNAVVHGGGIIAARASGGHAFAIDAAEAVPHTAAVKLVALTLLGVAIGCSSTKTTEDHLEGLPADAKFAPGLVSVAGGAYSKLPAEKASKAQMEESKWIQDLRQAFEKKTESLGIAGGMTGVDIRITEIDPGSRAARYWAGFGAGSGHITAIVTVGRFGDLTIKGTLSGGFYGGDMGSVFKSLGQKVASELKSHRGK